MTGSKNRSIDEYDTSLRFPELIEEFEPLRLAVYTPSSISLPERKLLADRLFLAITQRKQLPIPKSYKPIFSLIEKDARFRKIQSIVEGNDILGTILTTIGIRLLLSGVEATINAMLEALEKDDDDTPESSEQRGSSSSVGESTDSYSEDTSSSGDGSNESMKSKSLVGKLSSTMANQLLNMFLELMELKAQRDISRERKDIAKEIEKQFDTELNQMLEALLKKAKDWKELLDLIGAIVPDIGWGQGVGDLKYEILDAYSELSKILGDIPELRELVDRLGRYKANLAERIWSSDALGKSEAFSITRGNDINRILPSELVKLSHPVAKYLFYAGLADGSLLTYQLRGEGWSDISEDRKGPVVICVDTSGSMTGLPEIIAKALSLAVVKEANKSNRAVHVILFGSRGEIQDLTFQKTESALSNLIKFIGYRFGGGTDFDSALNAAIDVLEKEQFKLADVLFVTDGYAEASHYTMEKLEKIKSEQEVSIYSLIIGTDDAGGTETFSDEVWILEGTDREDSSLATLRRIIKNKTKVA